MNKIGTLYKVNCKCGFTEDLFTGVGRNSRSYDTARQSMDDEILPRFDELLTSLKSWSIHSVIIRCKVCRTLSSVSSLVCTTADDKTITLTNCCPNCGRACTPYKKIDKIPCPKCGRRLKPIAAGHWD